MKNLEKINFKETEWLPSLNALRALEAVARLGSFRNAAEQLHVSPAAVHHLVRNLEEVLDASLVQRSGREIALTDQARAGMGDLHRAFDNLAAAVQKIRRFDRRRKLTLSVETSFAAAWLVGRLKHFQDRYPEIDVLLESSSRLVDLDRGEADVAVRYTKQPGSGYDCHRLYRDETIAVCSPSLLSGGDGGLENLKLLHFDWPHAPQIEVSWGDWLKMAGLSHPAPESGPRFNEYNMVIQSTIAGQGAALASRALVEEQLRRGILAQPVAASVKSGFSYFVMTAKARCEDPVLAAFVEWILSEVKVEF